MSCTPTQSSCLNYRGKATAPASNLMRAQGSGEALPAAKLPREAKCCACRRITTSASAATSRSDPSATFQSPKANEWVRTVCKSGQKAQCLMYSFGVQIDFSRSWQLAVYALVRLGRAAWGLQICCASSKPRFASAWRYEANRRESHRCWLHANHTRMLTYRHLPRFQSVHFTLNTPLGFFMI